MKTSLHATALSVVTIVMFLAFYPTVAIGATVDVAVGNGGLFFSPSSVTIHPGDTVRWTFSSTGHSTTSGSPGMPNNLWDSGIRSQGAVFNHTFPSAGTFPYYCIPHGGCCGMTGTVTVTSPTPTPTPPPMPGPPIVTTNPATLIASFSARLNGSVNPHGLTTTFHFRYGLTTSYGLTTPPQNRSGNTSQNVSANISGLMANHVYHFRIMASNAAGTRFGADRTFTTLSPTGPPVARTNAATNVASHSATLNGLVYPHGLSTSVNFQYGPTTSYGSTTPMQTRTGNTYQNVSANVSGLIANRVYHFRIKATNMVGTRFGNDRTFTTRPYCLVMPLRCWDLR
jgi:plastocyanin